MAKRALSFFLFLVLIVNFHNTFGQKFSISVSEKPRADKSLSSIIKTDATPNSVSPPNIVYESPQNYVINKAISPLSPKNTGGAVPAAIYGQTALFSGNAVTPSSYYIVTGVAIANDGQVYAADWFSNRIKVVGPAGGTATSYSGNYTTSPINGPIASASFYMPDALLFDAAENLYISDQGNNMIRKITPAGIVSTFAGSGAAGSSNGPGNLASFNTPRGLTIDKAGNLYVADQANNLIRKITPAGVVSTYAGTGAAGFVNGPALSATFDTPTAVEIDNYGILYVSDAGNNCIRKIDNSGVVTTFKTGMTFPRELRVDGTGNLYVVEQHAGKLTRIATTGQVTNFANNFSMPIGLAMDGKGFLYIGDGTAIYKVSISGYTIDKTLPPGLIFDAKTGTISGTPASAWPSTDYLITAYNGGGSSSTIVNITVGLTAVKKPSIINLPTQVPVLDANNNYNPGATSTNPETPITYTSSNPDIAEVLPNGLIHVKAPGQTTITAYQLGNENYYDASPVWQLLTVVEHLSVFLPNIPNKTVCDADFSVNGITSQPKVPVTYTSSNTAVATISAAGIVHIVGAGTTTITLAQNANPPLYVSATPMSKTLTVTVPVAGGIQIASNVSNVCEGTPAVFTAITSNGGIKVKYQWQLNGNNVGSDQSTFTSSTLTSTDKITCIYTNVDNSCVSQFPVTSNTVSLQVTKRSNPSVSISASVNYVFPGTNITFNAVAKDTDNPVTYSWQVNGVASGTNSATFSSTSLQNNDKVTCIIKDANTCSAPVTSNELSITIVDRITIPNTFTPNGDGINDTWNISGLISYAQCQVNVYDRYGRRVFRSVGYGQAWNGLLNGAGVPAATYYYVIDLGATNIPEPRMSGSITVLR